jgi:hypothetical protein|nr:MAG TPA: hypothetical protein [Bacteriophage sp.]
MSGKKKSGHKNSSLEKIVLATAILNFIKALMDFISRLTE